METGSSKISWTRERDIALLGQITKVGKAAFETHRGGGKAKGEKPTQEQVSSISACASAECVYVTRVCHTHSRPILRRCGDGRPARPGHRGGRGAAPHCVWSSTTPQPFHRDRPRGTQVSNNEVSMMSWTGEWPPRARTPSSVACPPPAAHEPRSTWLGMPRRLAASCFVGVLVWCLQPTVQKVVCGAMTSDQDD